MNIRRKLYILGAIWTFLSPLALVGVTLVEQANAQSVNCSSGAILAFGRRRWCGYFKNHGYAIGAPVRTAGVPANVNTVQEFITLIENDLNSNDNQRRTGAMFVILTMIGRGPGSPQAVTSTQLADWKERVRGYANLSENGSRSSGTSGRIDWFVSQHAPCGTLNTYYQAPENDVASFTNHAGNSDCEIASTRDDFIIFRDTNGAQQYTIRRECMNPMGSINALDPPRRDYNLNPNISVLADGQAITNPAVEVGSTITFRYSVRNNGTTPSDSTACTIYGNNRTGYAATPNPPTGSSSGGFVPPPASCPFTLNNGSTITIATETFVANTPNRTICRSLFVQPATPGGVRRGTEVCVPVANKPYVSVYGGDVSVGHGLAGATNPTCTNNTDASVISWNRGGSSGYAGAGTQYATFALRHITHFATSLGNQQATAPAPSALAFANTSDVTNNANAIFGGQFGGASCIKNLYGQKPGITQPIPTTVNGLQDQQAYEATGNITLGGGTIPAGKQTTVYIDGNLYLNSNITYADGWAVADAPSLRVIVSGNIYISNNVSRLDGLFVAQKNTVSGSGHIYTCTNPANPFVPLTLDGSLYNRCNSQLTVNGAFIADSVVLLRTLGSQIQAQASDTNLTTKAAEVFNYNASLWLPLPPEDETGRYDSITALPPIL